jgi:hypothetical protein
MGELNVGCLVVLAANALIVVAIITALWWLL